MRPTDLAVHQNTQPNHEGEIDTGASRSKKQKNRRFKKYHQEDNYNQIHNRSKRRLTTDQLKLLNLGLSFVPTPQAPHHAHTIRDTLLFNRRIRLKHFFQHSTTEYKTQDFPTEKSGWIPPPGLDTEIDSFTSYILTHMSTPRKNKFHQNLDNPMRTALKELRQMDDIIIFPADKGGGIVIQNTEDYINEAYRQLRNQQHYTQLPYDTTLTNAGHIKKTLLKLEEDKKIPKNSHKSLLPKNIRTSPIYFLPKIHKEGCPGRPIVSGIDSPTDIISQTMDTILKPLLKHIPSFIKDTRDFLSTFNSHTHLHEDEILVTINVSAL